MSALLDLDAAGSRRRDTVVTSAASLDAAPTQRDGSLRWTLLHPVEETARLLRLVDLRERPDGGSDEGPTR